MPYSDFAFSRIVFPFGDGFPDRFVEFEQAVLDGQHGQDPREAFGTAGEHVRGVFTPAIVALVEDLSSVLDQDCMPAVLLRIVGGFLKKRLLFFVYGRAWVLGDAERCPKFRARKGRPSKAKGPEGQSESCNMLHDRIA